MYWTRNPDEDLRRLERAAQTGDADAAQRLAGLRARSGDPEGAWTQLFEWRQKFDPLPDPQIDLLARVGFIPAVQIWRGANKKIQRFTMKLFQQLGQTLSVQLIGLILRKTLGTIFSDPRWYVGFPKKYINSQTEHQIQVALWGLVQQLQQWKLNSKLPDKIKKELIRISENFPDGPFPLTGRPRDLVFIELLDRLGRDKAAVLTSLLRKGSTERFANAADRLANIAVDLLEPTDKLLHMAFLGQLILPDLLPLLLQSKIERVEILPHDDPAFYKQEIKAKRFQIVHVKFFSEEDLPFAEKLNYGPFRDSRGKPQPPEVYILVWTADPDEALERAGTLLEDLGTNALELNISRYSQDRTIAKDLYSQNLHEAALRQPGWERKPLPAELAAKTKMYLYILSHFCGGCQLHESTWDEEREQHIYHPGWTKTLTAEEDREAQQDVAAVVIELQNQLGLKQLAGVNLETIDEEGYLPPRLTISGYVNEKNSYTLYVFLRGVDNPNVSMLADIAVQHRGNIERRDPVIMARRQREMRELGF